MSKFFCLIGLHTVSSHAFDTSYVYARSNILATCAHAAQFFSAPDERKRFINGKEANHIGMDTLLSVLYQPQYGIAPVNFRCSYAYSRL